MPRKRRRKLINKHVDKKLRNKLRMYFVISAALIVAVSYEIITGVVGFPFVLAGMAIGILLGFIVARVFHISWDHDAKQTISRLDILGGVILALYVVFAIFRAKIIGSFVHGQAIGGVSISITTGIMIGRMLGIRGRIIQVLKEQKVF